MSKIQEIANRSLMAHSWQMERISIGLIASGMVALLACSKPTGRGATRDGSVESKAKKMNATENASGGAAISGNNGIHAKSGQLPEDSGEYLLPKSEAGKAKPILEAQPKLPTVDLLVGPKERKVVAEVAIKERERNAGLMFREKLKENEGMVFVFETSQRVGFYMRNTTIKLSVAYIGRTGRIIEIYDLKPLEEAPVNSESDIIQFVLEMPRGWFKRSGVRIGHRVKTTKGELDEVLLKRR